MIQLHKSRRPLALVLIFPMLFALLLSGCGIFSPDPAKEDVGGGNTEPYPLATLPDILIENLIRSYDERNYEEYENLLDDEFTFVFSDDDIANLGQDGSWDRASDLSSTYNMFTGQPGFNEATKEVQPAIQSVDLRLYKVEPLWIESTEPGYLGTLQNTYTTNLSLIDTSGGVLEVSGEQIFHVVQVELDLGDNIVEKVYKLRFWRDTGREP